MAGSYLHILHGWSTIENMGDAAEAVDELLWLIEREIGEDRARDLLNDEFYPMCRGEKEPDKAFVKTRTLMRK